MIKRFEQAIEELSKLPEDDQQRMAEWILDELEDGLRWDQAFANSLPQLEQLGKKALEDYRTGKTQELKPDELE